MWHESITLTDGTKACLYHSWHCHKEKPYFADKTEIIHYIKYKNDCFDFCFSEDELEMLTAISRCNINDFVENYYPEDDLDIKYYNEKKNKIDTTECDYYDIRMFTPK